MDLSLSEAIRLGLENNPRLLEAFSTIQQFEWQLIAAQRQWYPTLQLSNGVPFAGYQWGTFVRNAYALPGARLGDQQRQVATKSQALALQSGASVNWTMLDLSRQPNINAASEALRQQKYLFDISARNIILEIQQEYFAIQSSQLLIDNFQQIYAINRQQLSMLEAQQSVGMVTVLDVEQTRSQLFSQLSQLVDFTNRYIQQSARLAESLALPADSLAIPSERARLQGEWTLSLQDTIDQARRQREEILASLAAAEAADWSGIAALRSTLPVVSLVGTGGLNLLNGYESVAVPEDPGERYALSRQWSAAAGIGFTWSIFDGGIQAANAQALRAQAREQRARAMTSELQVTQQVRSSYAKLRTARVAVESAEQAYRSAELAQEAARARFQVGVGDITSVVQTIQQLSQSVQQRANAMLNYNSAVVELYRFSSTWPGDSGGVPPSGVNPEEQHRRSRC
ncbi:TolC family protein [Synechococcus sp. RSCCF101]|uniref:TolC family protein n=1 Tax=Synechococcus sp. RSCCF101 TaxID=2511069 RepID=UPI001248ABC3|nr:TolC family protein [Synechococcus sp. RSCCF101]QEY31253.1 TolC family protein [Synechococcus sp. RSCCF101]